MEYPKSLTEKDWQKHKGILAKIIKESKKSGVGDLLTACEEAYAAFHDRFTEVKGDRDQQLNTWDNICTKEGGKLLSALDDVAKHARDKADEWGKKSSLVPKSTVTAVSNVAVAAENFITEVEDFMESREKQINDDCDKADELREKMMVALVEMFEDNLKKAYADSKEAASAFKVEPSAETYNKYFSGGNGVARRLATALRPIQMAKGQGLDIEDPQKFITALNPWATGTLMNAPSEAKDLVKAITDFTVVLKQIKTAYSQYVK